jgi:predicted nucleotidyltransferase component of viral defense system
VIGKQEILERAAEWNLRPEVVEKDYVLGWLLSAISQHALVRELWILKGGTCIKKCFFETYRFSEDLDFSLLPAAPYDADGIMKALREVATLATDASGIQFNHDQFLVKERRDKPGRLTFEGRIGYQGPLAVPNWPRILFDLTQHEPVISPTTTRAILHPYSDSLPAATEVRTYAFEELLAEKTRALYERTRPRDLYDVVYVLDNLQEPLNAALVRSTFLRKCHAKEFDPPTVTQIVERVRNSEEVRADWNDMLSHQLPYPAPLDGSIARLEPALAWLTDQETAQIVGTSASLPAPPMASSPGEVTAPRQLHGGPIELLRFAGANRLLVAFSYSGKSRIVEPYSLRYAQTTGNLNFYGWELASRKIKCFTVAKMHVVHVLQENFAPRYHVELSTSGGISRGRWRWK